MEIIGHDAGRARVAAQRPRPGLDGRRRRELGGGRGAERADLAGQPRRLHRSAAAQACAGAGGASRYRARPLTAVNCLARSDVARPLGERRGTRGGP